MGFIKASVRLSDWAADFKCVNQIFLALKIKKKQGKPGMKMIVKFKSRITIEYTDFENKNQG